MEIKGNMRILRDKYNLSHYKRKPRLVKNNRPALLALDSQVITT